jgi:anti-anti-sigma factor
VFRREPGGVCHVIVAAIGPGAAVTQFSHILHISGECDIARFPELCTALESVPREARRIIVDMSDARVLDSTCLAELLLAKHRWDREGRTAAVVALHPFVLRMLAIANVRETLNVFQTFEDAERFVSVEGRGNRAPDHLG